jgi:hypothetical protein
MAEALHILFYESGNLSLAAEHFPPHKARYTEFMQRGVLLSLGPFADASGSMAVFTTREAAEEFASDDPFVLNGVVSAWQIREWRAVTSVLLGEGIGGGKWILVRIGHGCAESGWPRSR